MINWTALIVFVLLFGLVTGMGFIAARWRRGDLDHAARMGTWAGGASAPSLPGS